MDEPVKPGPARVVESRAAHRRALCAGILLAALACPVPGQEPDAQAGPVARENMLGPKPYWPVMQDRIDNMGWGDLDLDGDADVAIHYHANRQQYLALYRNEGGMTYSRYDVFQIPGGDVEQVAFEDIDGDRYPDLLIVRFRGPNTINRNDGKGGFDSRGSMLGLNADDSHEIIGSDIDGDGDTDLVVANAGKSKRYLNDGFGNFSPGRAINRDPSGARSVVAGDVDGDGDVDLLLGTHYGHVVLYTNHGNGTFDADGIQVTPTRMGSMGTLVLVDADADGDLDLFASDPTDVEYFENAGDGNFEPPVELGGGGYLLMDDMDGDDDIDFVTSPAQVFLNDGPGVWSATERFINSDNTQERALIDVDNDNDLDLVLLPHQTLGLKVYLNNTIARTVTD